MNFQNKLNCLFAQLHCSNIDIAREGSLDPSLISRYRSGKRIPHADSYQLHALVHCLLQWAVKADKLVVLRQCLADTEPDPISAEIDQEEWSLALRTWLSNGDLPPKNQHPGNCVPKKIDSPSLEKKLISFSYKLDLLMSIFDISNIRLARALHIDPSLISRLRTGVRHPSVSSWFPDLFCGWLTQHLMLESVKYREEKLHPIFGEAPPQDSKELKKQFLSWICADECQTQESRLLDRFLSQVDHGQGAFQIPQSLIHSIEVMPTQLKGTMRSVGSAGFRDLILRFLTLAATQEQARTLYLYSDQPFTWLQDDADFAQKWMLLMSLLLQNKHKICIIHKIQRSLPEVVEGLEKWIPLYMRGQIQAYFLEEASDQAFCQTRFIISDQCVLHSSFVAGTEEEAEYVLTANKEQVDYHTLQFQVLISKAKALLKTYTLETESDFLRCLTNISAYSGSSSHLHTSLSIATMSDRLFEQILARHNLDASGLNFAREYRALARKHFKRSLETGRFTELVALPPPDSIEAEEIPVGIPGLALHYSEVEFCEHLRSVYQLLQENDAYRFIPLPQVAFANVCISLWTKDQSILIKTDRPVTVFHFENALMRRSFDKYFSQLRSSAMHGAYHKSIALKALKVLGKF